MSKFTKRLTNALRREIVDSILASKFNKKSADEVVAPFNKWAYEVFYKNHVQAVIPSGVTLNSGLVMSSENVDIPDKIFEFLRDQAHSAYGPYMGGSTQDYADNHISQLLLSSGFGANRHFYIRLDHKTFKLPFSSPVPVNMWHFYTTTLTEAQTEALIEQLKPIVQPITEYIKSYLEAHKQATSILSSVTTFKRANEIWPEIEPYLTRAHGSSTKETALVPYGAIRSLSQQLGLKIIK